MPKVVKRTQVGPRLTPESLTLLEAIQRFYGERAGLSEAVSQSQAIEIMLRETAQRLKIKGAK